MRLRSTGPVVMLALTTLLLAASVTADAVPATGWQAQYREDTCFGETPSHIGKLGQPVIGTDGDDVILGGGRVEAGEGDDLICDADYVLAGPGDDRIRLLDGGTGKGNGGSDEHVSIAVSVTAVGATMVGGPGSDIFWGGTMGDDVRGGSGDDVARTGGGDDQLDLGSGDDEAYGGPGADLVDGSIGADIVDGGHDKDQCLAVEDRTSCRRVT